MPEPALSSPRLVRAAALAELREKGRLTVTVEGHTIALFLIDGKVFAVDNRCPHMGFPLDRGTVRDCILTCHWHHARFDLATGGTFDQWADDVRAFPAEVQDGAVMLDLAPPRGAHAAAAVRLRDGIERNIPLVIAKAALRMIEVEGGAREVFRATLEFGARNRRAGWGAGLTTLTCLMNLSGSLAPDDRARALYHGVSSVASDCDGRPPRFPVRPLPGAAAGAERLSRWMRQFVEVRDSEGAERCIASAVAEGCGPEQIAEMLFAAATDHRYIDTGHPVDFINKSFEALDCAGWDLAEPALTSLAPVLAEAARMEESNEWRRPIDLVAILERAFESLPDALEAGAKIAPRPPREAELLEVMFGEDPGAIADAMLSAVREGVRPLELAAMVTHAAALRIARFPTSNEFGDWDTAHHSFTFAHAVHRGLNRVNSPALVRGVFDAAMTVYLNRFLNVPPAKIPQPRSEAVRAEDLLAELGAVFDRQQQVNEAGAMVARYLGGGFDRAALCAALGHALVRENREFHSIQGMEAAFAETGARAPPAADHFLIATARYLAAHAPSVRSQEQTFRIAQRLHRGEHLFEE